MTEAEQVGAYLKTTVPDIAGGLRKLFESMELADEKTFTLTSTHNLVLLASSRTSPMVIEELVSSFASVHPSRFLVVVIDERGAEISAAISARCHAVSGDKSVCSEVIRLDCPPSLFNRLASIIRSNALTGRSTEFFVCDSGATGELFEVLAPLADHVFFDSALFESGFESVAQLFKYSTRLTDLEWLRLSVWREQIRDVFDRAGIHDLIPSLAEITIRSGRGEANREPTSALLLAGWIAARLRFEPDSFSGGSFELSAPHGRTLRLSIDSEGGRSPFLDEVAFRFADPSGSQISLRRGAVLETVVSGAFELKGTRPFDDETDYGVIRRYHLVGESTANLQGALRVALELVQCRRAGR